MKVHFRVLEVNVIDSYPTKHMGQIKMDHRFESSTAIWSCTSIGHLEMLFIKVHVFTLELTPAHPTTLPSVHPKTLCPPPPCSETLSPNLGFRSLKTRVLILSVSFHRQQRQHMSHLEINKWLHLHEAMHCGSV